MEEGQKEHDLEIWTSSSLNEIWTALEDALRMKGIYAGQRRVTWYPYPVEDIIVYVLREIGIPAISSIMGGIILHYLFERNKRQAPVNVKFEFNFNPEYQPMYVVFDNPVKTCPFCGVEKNSHRRLCSSCGKEES
jgi:hypothetical protein